MTDSVAIRGDIVPVATTKNPAQAYLHSLRSPGSRDRMGRVLDAVAGRYFAHTISSMPWAELTKAHIDAILDQELHREMSVATVNHLLSALKGVLGACFDLELITADQLMRIRRIKSVRGGPTDLAGRYVSPAERAALIDVCDRSRDLGQRDAAILGLLMGLGLRRAEVTALDHEDILDHDIIEKEQDDEGKEVITHLTALQISGKGRKKRVVYLNDGARDALLDWLAVRGSAPGALFWPGHKDGTLDPGKRLSSQGLYVMLRKRAKQGGVAAFTPHDLRRTFASDLLDAGVDISSVAKILGHSNVATTMRYDRRGERAVKSAARTVHFPYERRPAGPPAPIIISDTLTPRA